MVKRCRFPELQEDEEIVDPGRFALALAVVVIVLGIILRLAGVPW